MKKIICLLLALLCTFAMFSCNEDTPPATDNNDNGNNQQAPEGNPELDNLIAVINSSKPTKIVTHTDYKYGDDVFKGRYTTYIDRANNKSQFDFSYQRMAVPGEDISDSHIMTIPGTVYYKDGQVSDTEGALWSDPGYGYLELALSLSANKLDNITFSEDGEDMTATVSAENSIRVFGTAIAADGDITIEIDTNGKYLYTVKISYTAKDTGAIVAINTSYDYANVTLDF